MIAGYIYKILSPTGKIYIGQTNNINRRFSYYKTLKCKKQNLIYRSLVKYGVDSHKFEIIYKFNINEVDINELEIFFIAAFNSYHHDNKKYGLNLTKGGKGFRGWKASAETIQKMILSRTGIPGHKHTDEVKLKLSKDKKEGYASGKYKHPALGVKRLPITGEKIRATKIGKKASEEVKEILRQAHQLSYATKGRRYGKPILQYTKDGIFVKEWEYIKAVTIELGINNSDIVAVCKGKRKKSAGGFVWKYKEAATLK